MLNTCIKCVYKSESKYKSYFIFLRPQELSRVRKNKKLHRIKLHAASIPWEHKVV